MKRLHFFLFLFLSLSVWADEGMHTWRSHIAYGDVHQIVDAGNAIYALAGNALMQIDKRTEEMTCYSKQDGFHGSSITHIGYDTSTRTLVIIYEDGLIDFLQNGVISALSDLQLKQLSASKKANSLTIHQGYAYLGMPFGVVVVNIKKQEIADTYYIGLDGKEVDVLALSLSADSIYALSSESVYAACKKDNLLDFNVWNQYKPLASAAYQDLTDFRGQLYLISDSVVYTRNTSGWQPLASDLRFYAFRSSGQHLYVMHNAQSLVEYIPDKGFHTTSSPYDVEDAIYDNESLWYAARQDGLIHHTAEGTQAFLPEGPAVNIPYRMKVVNGRLYVVPGARWAVQESRLGYVMIYDIQGDRWTNISGQHIYSQTNLLPTDFMNVAVDPFNDNHFLVTSYGTGLYELENNQLVRWYNNLNSPLDSRVSDKNTLFYVRTDGALFDENGNLWFVNMSGTPLHVASAQQLLAARQQEMASWNKYEVYNRSGNSFSIVTSGELLIDNRYPNYKWIPYARSNPGLILYDDNNTPFYSGDDRTYFNNTFVDQDGKTIAPTSIYAVVQDKQNDLWIAVDEGLIIIPSSIDFRLSNSCTRVKIPRNDGTNLADYLLGTERVNAIAVDGANRKWIGTESSGLYLISEDGLETIEHFTTDNSPLPSDQILSVAIDPRTGRVFVGTGNGLMSYQSDAAEPEDSFYSTTLCAYPNPVRPDYQGVITIAGLMDETVVKIVDNGGNLVCQTRSNGGLAVWDGKNGHGQRVASGVYTAFCNTADGANHAIVKILVIH